jgi:hypothetical protein
MGTCCAVGACADWGCGASGNELFSFCLAVLGWLDWGGLAKRGISLDIRNAPANVAIEKHFEYLQPLRFIEALPVLEL